MNKCIYKKETNATQTFEKQEHIFPAGIGGINKLPKGYVCDEVNGVIFSRMELDFMRNSPVGIIREFEGPGKRGSFSESKATKSNVGISTSNTGKKELAYLKKSKIYALNQIQISILNNEYNIIMDNSEEFTEVKIDGFISRMEELVGKGLEGRHVCYVEDEEIDDGKVFVGELDSKLYIGVNNKEIDRSKIITNVNKAICSMKKKEIEMNTENLKVSFGEEMRFNMNSFFKVSVKIVFNYLANRLGQDEVLSNDFDKLREYVLGIRNEYNVRFTDKGISSIGIELPERCHAIAISKDKECLNAVISFYGGAVNVALELSDTYNGSIDTLIGVCDWKNKDEYDIL